MSDLLQKVDDANRVYICGNGGSAANAIHMANDLVSVGVRAHALCADIATLTAIANDYGYERVFSRLLKVYGESGDLLIALSGSGNSPNILKALEAAKELGMSSWLITGNQTAAAIPLADNFTLVGNDMQSSEEKQIAIGHRLRADLMKIRAA